MRTRTFLPRPEYPRPDRQRAFVHGVDWVNLNGPWNFRFDGDRVGLEEQWFARTGMQWPEQIIVPFPWESLAAWGEADSAGNDNYFASRVYRNPVEVTPFNYRKVKRYEVGWYQRTVVLPDGTAWQGKRVILTIGAADFFTDAWCNGRHLGRYEGGYTPFEFDLTDALERNEAGQLTASLVLRVEDPMENREQPVGKQWGWYSSVSGIWQTVFIEPRAAVYTERFEIVTELERKEARLKLFTRGDAVLGIEIASPTGLLSSHRCEIREGKGEITIPINPVIPWDPNDPQLYRLTLTLGEGAARDVVHSYFGMRTLSAQPATQAGAPAALCLNGQPIYLRGALYQSYHPEGIYTAGDVEALKDDILQAKRFGFDLLRIHIKIDDPLVLYYADTLGILLMADFPNFGEGGDTPTGRRRFEEMMRAGMQRDYNHPSIVAWCLFNETWGFGGQAEFVKLINPDGSTIVVEATPGSDGPKKLVANQQSYTWVEAMWQLAKSLDPTRLVEDMSVVAWEHLEYYGHGQTDINSWHFYIDNYERARTHIREIVSQTYAGSTFNYVPGFQQGTQPLINSEYGGVGALDGDRDISWSFKFLTNELRLHGALSAYIFTELHDVEWERNGFLNYDRTPKDFGYDPVLINNGDVLPIDAPPVARCEPSQEVGVDVFSSHFARKQRENVTFHWRLSGVDSLGWFHEDLASGSKPITFPHHHVELAERVVLRMPDVTMLCTLWVRAVAPDGTLVAANYVQFFVDAGFPATQAGFTDTILRVAPHEWSGAHWSDGMSANLHEAQAHGCAYGRGHGFFEWQVPLGQAAGPLTRLRVLCEASACRPGTPQTDASAHPTSFRMSLNGIRIYEGTLPNHPHDARGALSYLREGRGAYGYLAHATVEGELLAQVLERAGNGRCTLRCEVPEDAPHRGGLVIYTGDNGRFPLPPTIICQRSSA